MQIKPRYMLFSYNKNASFPDIRVGNNKIIEISVTKFFGIHLDKKLNFVNHITEISMKVANSILLLYKLNRFLLETILKMLYTLLFHPYLSYGLEAWHGTYQNNTSEIFVLQNNAIHVINNLAYNEHTNALLLSLLKKVAMQGWARAINTLSVQRPQSHNTNPQNERRERENSRRQKVSEQLGL